jgi:hypothetical protein
MALFALCGMPRAASRVSFLMCLFCVRAAVSILATTWLQSMMEPFHGDLL